MAKKRVACSSPRSQQDVNKNNTLQSSFVEMQKPTRKKQLKETEDFCGFYEKFCGEQYWVCSGGIEREREYVCVCGREKYWLRGGCWGRQV